MIFPHCRSPLNEQIKKRVHRRRKNNWKIHQKNYKVWIKMDTKTQHKYLAANNSRTEQCILALTHTQTKKQQHRNKTKENLCLRRCRCIFILKSMATIVNKNLTKNTKKKHTT